MQNNHILVYLNNKIDQLSFLQASYYVLLYRFFFFVIKNNKTIKQSAQQQLPTLYTLNRQTNFAEDIKALNCIVGLEIGMDLHKQLGT